MKVYFGHHDGEGVLEAAMVAGNVCMVRKQTSAGVAGCLLCPSVFTVSSQPTGRVVPSHSGRPSEKAPTVQRRAHMAWQIQSASQESEPSQFKQLLHY